MKIFLLLLNPRAIALGVTVSAFIVIASIVALFMTLIGPKSSTVVSNQPVTIIEESFIPTTEWDSEMAIAFNDVLAADANIQMSTRHQNSPLVITGVHAAGSNGTLNQKGDGRSSGSIRMYAGINGTTASVAILHIVGSQVNFAVLKGNVYDAGFCTVPGSCLDLGGGKYMDTSKAVWVAAWTLSKTIGKADNPADYLTVNQGWAAWTHYQQKYNLYIQVLSIKLP